jgi:hypothetical protein
MNTLQLSEFAKLNQVEKKELLTKINSNKGKNSKINSIGQYLKNRLKLDKDAKVI